MKQFVKLWPTALLGEMFSQLFMSFFLPYLHKQGINLIKTQLTIFSLSALTQLGRAGRSGPAVFLSHLLRDGLTWKWHLTESVKSGPD